MALTFLVFLAYILVGDKLERCCGDPDFKE